MATLRFFKFHLCHSKKNRLYPFVPLLLSFVPQKVRKYSDFKISEMCQEGKAAIFKAIEMGPTAKGKIQTGTNDYFSNVDLILIIN